MALPARPTSRHDFRIAVLCALWKEAEMVERVFDRTYQKEEAHGKAHGDTNTYTTGSILRHNVVLAYCPDMGGSASAAAATHLKHSFPALEITLVVGICGAAPYYKNESGSQEIVLGDCIISTALVQLDFGRVGPDGFSRKDSFHALGRAGASIRTLLNKLRADQSSLETDLGEYLSSLQKDQTLVYPGIQQDCLYKSDYIHRHSPPCPKCNPKLGLCERDCDDIGCLDSHLLQRLHQTASPRVHFGTFGSSNAVIKSGSARDTHTKEDNIIAFEMEGCGVWDVSPTIIIKAACDYADSHKNKKWQRYSAAVAASGLKAVLGQIALSDPPDITTFTPVAMQDAVSQADAAIRKYYVSSNRLHVERLSGQKFPLDECYINLALVEKSSQGKEPMESFTLESRLQLDAEVTGMSISLNKLFDRQILSSGVNGLPRRIFIRGRAGVGKTTLCKKLIHEFLQGRLGVESSFDRLLWIPLRRLDKQKAGNWRNILQSAYMLQDPTWRQSCESYSDKLYDPDFLNRTLLLFDGLDEISHGWKEDHEFYDFLASIICDSPNVIITSRPQVKTFDSGSFDMELETIGFSEEQVDSYIENRMKHKNTIQDMKSFLNQRPLVQSLLRIPIQLDAFCMIWPSQEIQEDDSHYSITHSKSGHPTSLEMNSISTMTTLYNAISLELCRKDMRRQQPQSPHRGMSDFEVEQAMAKELAFLGELAFQGLWANIIEYYPKHWNHIGLHASTQLPTPHSATLDGLSFLRSSDTNKQDPTKRNYYFLHLTFQEFFAARHFVDHWIYDKSLSCLRVTAEAEARTCSPLQFIQLEKYNPRYNIFWRFVTGLIQILTESSSIPSISSQRNSVSSFFRQLEDYPVDMFGHIHSQLLMCCLSEIKITYDSDTQRLRQRLENTMLKWPLSFSTWSEFPENVLHQKLVKEQLSPKHDILEQISDRWYFSPALLEAVLPFLAPAFSLGTRIDAAHIVYGNWRGDPTELIQHIKPLCFDLYKDERYLRFPSFTRASKFRGSDGSLEAMLSVFRNKNEPINFRRGMGNLLLHIQISPMHSRSLVMIMTDSGEDKLIRKCAAGLLQGSPISLDDREISMVMSLLYSTDDLELRSWALRVMANQALPTDTVPLLIDISKDIGQGYTLRSSALELLTTSIPTDELLTILISIIINSNDDSLQDDIRTLYLDLPVSLSERNAEKLIAIFQDEHRDDRMHLRAWAYSTLLACNNLSRNSLAAMIRAIEQADKKLLEHVGSPRSYFMRLPLPDAISSAVLQAMTSTNVELREMTLVSRWWKSFILPEVVIQTVMQAIRSRNTLFDSDYTFYLAYQPRASHEELLFLASVAKTRGDFNDIMKPAFRRRSDSTDNLLGLVDQETRNWRNVYSFLKSHSNYDVSCYEWEGYLYMWHSGRKYQLSTTPASTKRLLKAIEKIGDKEDYFEPPESSKADAVSNDDERR